MRQYRCQKYGSGLHWLAISAEEGKVTQMYIIKIVIIIYGYVTPNTIMYCTARISIK